MRLVDRIRDRTRPARARSDTPNSDWFEFAQIAYRLGWQGTLTGPTETIPQTFTEYSGYGYQGNGVVFACMHARMLAFSAPRISFRRLNNGRPGDWWRPNGGGDLTLLDRPWVGGTLQRLLMRMIVDVDLAGNAYIARSGRQLVRLRPDWVDLLLTPILHNGRHIGWEKAGYLYTPQDGGETEPAVFDVSEVAHWAPIPDPLARYRGMSWLTPVVREVAGDVAATRHQLRFFESGATPSLIVTWPKEVDPKKLAGIRKVLREENQGIDNAYEPLALAGGADVTIAGRDLKQVEFSTTRGAGETRIAAAAGIPPVIVGLSEGLKAATYSNYGQARRRLADGTLHPLWNDAAGALATIIPPPAGSELAIDPRDVPLLREDTKDAAAIEQIRASTINSLVLAGFTPESAVAAVTNEDMSLLEHTGGIPVQLHPDGELDDNADTDDDQDEDDPPALPANADPDEEDE